MNTSKSSKQNEQQSSIPILLLPFLPTKWAAPSLRESAAKRQGKQRMLPPSTSYSNQLEVGLSCAIYSKAFIADIEFNTPPRSIATHSAADISDA